MKNYFMGNSFKERMENTALDSSGDECIFLLH
jgi:hypothetical protein